MTKSRQMTNKIQSPNGKKGVTIMELLVVVGIFFIMIILLAPFVRMVKGRAHIINCENNLRALSLGLHNYAADHNEAFPPDLAALYPNYVGDKKAFDCPATNAVGTPEKADYRYIAGLTEASQPTTIILEDNDNNHKRRGKNILRINGLVE